MLRSPQFVTKEETMSQGTPNRQQYKVGAIVKIPLGDGQHTYARILEPPLFAFYDALARDDLDVDTIITKPILFKVWVMRHAITSGRWLKVGHRSLDSDLQQSPFFFKQDALRPEIFTLYRDGKEFPATREESKGLERAAVWEPEHVEERLRDYYAGRANRWVNLLKLPD